MIRMAGRGGLRYLRPSRRGRPSGCATTCRTNSTIGDADSPQIVNGTDVLTVRGVFTTPLYQINSKDKATIVFYRANGTTVETDPALATIVKLGEQRLADVLHARTCSRWWRRRPKRSSEALVLEDASNFDNYAVVELIPSQSTVTATQAVLMCQIRPLSHGPYNVLHQAGLRRDLPSEAEQRDVPRDSRRVPFLRPSELCHRRQRGLGADAKADTGAFHAGHRHSLRAVRSSQRGQRPSKTYLSTSPTTSWTCRLPSASTRLGTWRGRRPPGAAAEPAGLTTILADPVNGYISEAANGSERRLAVQQHGRRRDRCAMGERAGVFARVSLLARTDRRDWKYEAPAIGTIEDRTYLATDALNLANATAGSKQQRQYRRRILQTVIDMRNL